MISEIIFKKIEEEKAEPLIRLFYINYYHNFYLSNNQLFNRNLAHSLPRTAEMMDTKRL